MRFSTRGLDESFTYPCTKADVREAFGDDLLDSASLGGYSVDHYFLRGEARKEITGRVILDLSVSYGSLRTDEAPRHRAYLTAYRVRKDEWSDHLHWQVRETMRGTLRTWVQEMFARSETAPKPHEEILVELREGVLHTHRRRRR
ncbi:hypothetical protein EON77_12900 [bacterium]|nr:MAG: hypothetical protein EON77_12900 [bacterium]